MFTCPRGAVGQFEVGEQAGQPLVDDGEVVAAGFLAQGAGKPGLSDPTGAGDQQVAGVTDPASGGALLEQGPVRFARGPEVDIFDGGPDVAQPCRAHAGLEAPGIAAGDLAVDAQAKPFGVTENRRSPWSLGPMARHGSLSCVCTSMKGEGGPWPRWGRESPLNAMPSSFIWRSWSRVGCVSIVFPFNGSNRGVVPEARTLRDGYCRAGSRARPLPLVHALACTRGRGGFEPDAMERSPLSLGPMAFQWLTLQDGIDRGTGPRPDRECPLAGRFQRALAVRLRQAHDAEAGSEPLLGGETEQKRLRGSLFPSNAVAQDHLDQRRGVRSDLRGPTLQPLRRPFGMARSPLSLGPMARHGSPGRHVFGDGGMLAVGRGSDVGGDALAKVEYLDRPGRAERAPSARRCEPDPDLLPQQAVRGRVIMLVHLDVPVFN